MKEINVNKKFFNDYTYDFTLSAESNRYYNDTNYIKIIHSRLLKDDREKIIRELYYFDYPDIVTPKFILKEKGKFIGYGMDYCKGYDSLAYHFEEDDPSFQEKKDLMIRISKIFDYFDDKYFAYCDIHSFNVLYKDGDIKLIDLDGGILRPYINGQIDYNVGIRMAQKELVRYTLATINGISQYDLSRLSTLKNRAYFKKFMDSLPYNVRRLYEFALSDICNVIGGITPALGEITEAMCDETNDIIEKKLSLY